jgi:hypothetical protein
MNLNKKSDTVIVYSELSLILQKYYIIEAVER